MCKFNCTTNVIRKNQNHGGSCINYPDWIINKKAKINSIDVDDQCFHNTAIVALSYEEKLGGNNKEHKILNNWRGINYPWWKDYWKKFEKNNPTSPIFVLNVKKCTYILPVFQDNLWK